MNNENNGSDESSKTYTLPDCEIKVLPETEEPDTAGRYTIPELICVFISWAVGYAYTYAYDKSVYIAIVFSGLVLMTYLIYGNRLFSLENCIWLGCFALASAGCMISLEAGGLILGVWDTQTLFFLVHLFAVWFVLSASGKMYKGETSTYIAADALNGFVFFPFRYIFRRISVLVLSVLSLFKKKEKKNRNYYLIPAVLLSVLLFCTAAKLLALADSSFGRVIEKVLDFLRFDFKLDDQFVVRTMLAVPVGAYLYGLTAGSSRVKESNLSSAKDSMDGAVSSMKKIPAKFWTVIICFFSLLYLAFYAVQFRYLFGAFTRTLPDGFIVSQYAREGFFELCKVMGVNFALLIFVTRLVTDETADDRVFKTGCIAILSESIVFAVIAFSKLALYIDCFGFTPLRIQSLWLICVLFCGCVLWIINLLYGRRTFKLWLYIGGISLSVLMLL